MEGFEGCPVVPLDFIDDELRRLAEAGLERRLVAVTTRQGRTVEVAGRTLLSFCSNDYLGLAGDPRLAKAAAEALERYGLGSAASRLVSGNMTLHETLEARLAEFKGTEAAILFCTGYAANLGTIPALVGRGDLVVSDRLNHASIIDGCRLSGATLRVYAHCEVEGLERILKRGSRFRRRLVVTDTVFSMDGDVAPLAEIVEVAARHDAMVMVDEAHATGVLGETGRGAAEALGVSDRIDIQMGTLSKGLGALGGYVAGSARLIEFLRQRARSFIYSTAPPVAVCAAVLAALDVVEADPGRRRRCLDLARHLRNLLSESRPGLLAPVGGPLTPIIPVVVGDPQRACRIAEALFERGFLVRAIRPPTVPAGTSRLRISVTAAHTREDVQALAGALDEVLSLCLPEGGPG